MPSTSRFSYVVALLVIAITAVAPIALAQEPKGLVCVAPRPKEPPTMSSPAIPPCESNNLLIKVDDQDAFDWSRTDSVALNPLDATKRHRVTVLCDKKPQQSFTFSFSIFDERNLCLFLNDLYQTVQLWERKRAPWCKCT